MEIRRVQHTDHNRIAEILLDVKNFNPEEVRIALELVDDAVEKGERSDYQVYVLEEEDSVIRGYTCYGKTPLTDSTFDFYWLAVDPASQGKGYGRVLISFVEEQVRRAGGTILVLETSSLESYNRTLRIYRECGYQIVARIKNFYRPGDDKIILTKELV
ncbi:GNAT family N-acetyltransferase [bacterium]|nr:GNAT family N-acetyltransferase [bacterium]MCI0605755.1 GNAT family N-acetyltransferase [bacterium]